MERPAIPEFSIPMRGNEVIHRGRMRVNPGSFSIPMRGNEVLASIPIGSPSALVFDPHEG